MKIKERVALSLLASFFIQTVPAQMYLTTPVHPTFGLHDTTTYIGNDPGTIDPSEYKMELEGYYVTEVAWWEKGNEICAM